LRRAGQLRESEDALRLALSYVPDSVEALIVLAHVLHRRGRQNEADAVVERIVESMVRPDADGAATPLRESLLVATVDLAELLRGRERTAQADAVIECIMALEPDNLAMNRQFSMLLLRCGDFKHGWQEWDLGQVVPFRQPVWEGGSLAGKTILVRALHGYGDAIQFLRLLPDVKARGANVILEHQPALETLLQGVAGSSTFQGDRFRSCRLADYAWLAQLPQLRYSSLQKGPAAEQIASPAGAKLGLTDLGPELHDWADTAAAIMNLDLVITVDTAVAHLAGALGRPVWTLLPYHACWRWLEGREDSPWYPTMRLFRQSRQGDWTFVLQNLIRELDLFRLR
jgi:hypothetical protein